MGNTGVTKKRALGFDTIWRRTVIFVFIMIYCGFYYPQYLPYITLCYLLLGGTFIWQFVKSRQVPYTQFIWISLLFISYSFVSTLWSVNYNVSQGAVLQLIKSFVVAVCVISLIRSKDDYKWALFALSLAGIVYAILYLQNVDIDQLTDQRLYIEDEEDQLPNVNTVGLFLSFSFIYFIYTFFSERKYWYLMFAAIAFVVTFILGARKSIITLFIGILFLLFKLKSKSRIHILLICCGFIFLLFLFIPPEYLDFVSERLSQLNFFSDKINRLDDSDELRVILFQQGLEYWGESPLFGNGYYCFSQLFKMTNGVAVYSHNNFIETIVGGGIIGFVLYYALYYVMLKRIWTKERFLLDDRYLLLIIFVVLLFNSISIVILNERFIWILLGLMYVGASYVTAESYENRISGR